MPIYEYHCRDCGQEFFLRQSMLARSRGEARCPQCSSARVTQKVSAFTAQTSRKS
jgi:putative FmdB family regulatory protein